MDNVTHTLVGIAAAELFATTRFRTRPGARIPLWVASAVANNLPDLDVALTWTRGSERLDYLLHHRGHTHTFLLAPLQGMLWLFLFWFLFRRQKDWPWKQIALLSLLGPVLHIAADSWNTYGVHPFWPWNNGWYYGDLVFIIEPWLWIALLPPVWSRARSTPGKTLALLLLGFIVGISWYHPFVQPVPAAIVSLVAAAWLFAQRKIVDDRLRICGALLLCSIVFFLFGVAQARIRTRFSSFGSEITVLTHPANPFCATVFTAGFNGESYRAGLYTAAAWPALVPAALCRKFNESETSAGLKPNAGAVADEAQIPIGEFRSNRKEFERLASSCRGRAFLRFARIPFWFTSDGRDYFGDLRFDRDRALGFAEIPLGADLPCPSLEPPWTGRFFPAL